MRYTRSMTIRTELFNYDVKLKQNLVNNDAKLRQTTG